MGQKEEEKAACEGGRRKVLRKFKEPADHSITEAIGGECSKKGNFCREDKEKLPSGIIVSSHQGEKSLLESSHMPIRRPFTGKEEWSILRSPVVFLTEFQIYDQSR